MKEQKRVTRKLIVMILLACVGASVHSKDQKPVVYSVFGRRDADFVATLHTIESPANRWRAGEEPFPVDVAEFARRAKQHLLRRHPDISGTVNCISAEIAPFTMKTLASKDVPEEPSNRQRVAWYLVFTFSVWLPNGKQLDAEERTVGVMLDGTILEMVKRKTP
jgi:hypothetical protein